MNQYFAIVISYLLFISSCSSPARLNSWKDPTKSHAQLHKILIVAIVHDSLSAIRANVEDIFVQALKKRGLNAAASLEDFGYKGRVHVDKEQTYVLLCNQGIDAVFTIALLDEKKVGNLQNPYNRNNASSYYYNRVLSYPSIRANPKTIIQTNTTPRFIWEATLFNLSTLSPIYWVQTQPFVATTTPQQFEFYCKIILNNLIKQNIIK